MKRIIRLAGLFVMLSLPLFLSAAICSAQNVSFYYSYKMTPAMITEAPEIPGGPDFKYPEEARKNGAQGKVVLTFTLGEDSKIRDIKVVEGLPHGITEALIDAIQKMYFKPAKNRGVPAPVEATIELKITVVFDENDPNVKKPKITFLPTPVYPENQRAEKYKGKVSTRIIFFADGTLKVNGINSVLPREFDKAAFEAAQSIKFEPAVHKKSQKPVTQVMTVEFDFKP